MSLRSRVAGLLSRATSSAPVSSPVPSDTGARYAPERDGEPDPGEVVWAWVPYEDDPSQGKDRPVLVLQTDGDGWTGPCWCSLWTRSATAGPG